MQKFVIGPEKSKKSQSVNPNSFTGEPTKCPNVTWGESVLVEIAVLASGLSAFSVQRRPSSGVSGFRVVFAFWSYFVGFRFYGSGLGVQGFGGQGFLVFEVFRVNQGSGFRVVLGLRLFMVQAFKRGGSQKGKKT